MTYDYPYVYSWGNNEKRAGLRGRTCRVVARGRMNSVLVEFEDGRREVVSRYALRRRPHSRQECKDLLTNGGVTL